MVLQFTSPSLSSSRYLDFITPALPQYKSMAKKKKKKALDFQILADGNTSVTTQTNEPKSLISKVLLSTLKNISSPPFLCALLSKKSLKTML